MQAFVFDSHRPFHHNNIIDVSRRIYIIHDGCQSFDKYPTAEDLQILQEFADDEEDEEDEEEYDSDQEEIKDELDDLKDGSGEDEEEEIYGGERVKKRGEPDHDDEEAEIIGADEDLDDDLRVGAKRQRDLQAAGTA